MSSPLFLTTVYSTNRLNGSRAQSVLWLLEELQVPYDVEIYHRKSDMLAPPELQKVHPLGKSPVVTVTAPGSTQSVALAESGFIFEYLCEHFEHGKKLVPKRWKDGQEGQVLGETEAWMRYQYLMYYIEGSFMPNLVQFIILSGESCYHGSKVGERRQYAMDR